MSAMCGGKRCSAGCHRRKGRDGEWHGLQRRQLTTAESARAHAHEDATRAGHAGLLPPPGRLHLDLGPHCALKIWIQMFICSKGLVLVQISPRETARDAEWWGARWCAGARGHGLLAHAQRLLVRVLPAVVGCHLHLCDPRLLPPLSFLLLRWRLGVFRHVQVFPFQQHAARAHDGY